MALSLSNPHNSSNTGSTDTITTSSISFGSNTLAVVIVTGVLPNGRAAAPTISHGSGTITWTNRLDWWRANAAPDSDAAMVAIWTGPISTGGATTITVDFNANLLDARGTHTITVLYFSGYNTSSPVVQSFSDGGTTGRSGAYSGTLGAAPAATSYVVMGAAASNSTVADTTVGSGWTQIAEADPGDGTGFTQYRTGTVDSNVAMANLTATGSQAAWAIGGIEIKEALAPAAILYDANDFDNGTITNGNSYTFPLTVSAADAGRERLVMLGHIAGSDGTYSACTIDGVAATMVAQIRGLSTDTSYYAHLSLWRAAGTANTSINVVATYSGTAKSCIAGYCACWRMTNGGLHHATGSGTTNDPSLNLNITANGVAVGAGLGMTGTNITTFWSGLTENFDSVRATGDDVFSGASVALVSAATPRSVTCNWTPDLTASDDSKVGLTASFRQVVGATAYTILALPGAYSVSGQTVAVKRGKRITAASSSYAVTGSTATMKHGYWLHTPIAPTPPKLTAVSSTIYNTRTNTTVDVPAGVTATTLNPLDKKNANVVLSNGNLTVTGNDSGGNNWVRSNSSRTGKRYVEFTINTYANPVVGIADLTSLVYPGDDAGSFGIYGNGWGGINNTWVDWSTPFTTGDKVCMAVDLDAKLVWFRKNGGNWNNNASYNPATATGGFSIAAYTGTPHFVIVSGNTGSVITVNFGASTFAHSMPTGFVAWDTDPSGTFLMAGVFVGISAPLTPPAVTLPDGWSEIADSPLRVDGGSFRADYHIYWKRAALEGSSYTFSHSEAVTAAVIGAYVAASSYGDPVDAASKNTGTGNSSFLTGVTTTIGNTLLAYYGTDWQGTPSTPPTGFTEYFDELLTLATKQQITAGPTGDFTSANGNEEPTDPWGTWLIALDPASAAAAYRVSGQNVVLNKTGASSGSGTITTVAGNYAVTGQTVLAKRGLKATAAPSSYAITGAQVSLNRPRRVSALTGFYTVSGQAATPRYGRRVQATQSSYSISPDSVASGDGLIVLPGSYAVSGHTANLVYVAGSGGGVAVSATGESMTASTNSVSVTISGGIAAVVGGNALSVQTTSVDIITTGGVTLELTGTALEATTGVGTATVSLPKRVDLTGNGMTASVGTVTVNSIAQVSVTLTGLQMQTYVGTTSVGVVAGTSGRQKAGEMFEIARWMGH